MLSPLSMVHHAHAQLGHWLIGRADALDSVGADAAGASGGTVRQAGAAVRDTVVDKAQQYRGVYDSINGIVKAFWERLPYLGIALAVFALFWLLSRLFRVIIRKTLSKHARKQNLVLALNRLGSTIIVFMGFMIAMVVAIPGFTPAQLLSTLGLGSLAIGFAFKDIVQNLLSGMIILISEPFRIGDQIMTDKHEGIVEDIQIRATYLRTYDGRRIVIPNSQLFTNAVTVNTAYPNRRVQVNVAVPCQDRARAKAVILNAVKSCNSVAKDHPITIVLTELTDGANPPNGLNNLMVRWWIQTSTQVDVIGSTDEVLDAIQTALSGVGINLPCPAPQGLSPHPGDAPADASAEPAVAPAAPPPSGAAAALTTGVAAVGVTSSRDPSEDSQPEGRN